MTATTEPSHIEITRHDAGPIFLAAGSTTLSVTAGSAITIDGKRHAFDEVAPVALGELAPGTDYAIHINPMGDLYAAPATENPLGGNAIGGFHFAPGSRSRGILGGTALAELNPYSIWDRGFRPKAPDPRGMAFIATASTGLFWADIYLLGVDHEKHGTSRFGVKIATGRSLKRLNYNDAVAIYAGHGKRLMGAEEFFAAAYGVHERCSRSDEPGATGELIDDAARFISRYGLFDATGTMWQWGTDGHPDDPRPSIFGGSWVRGSSAGSRFANLDYWAGISGGTLSARGASDHLTPA